MTTRDQDVDRTLFDYVEILYRRRWVVSGVTAAVLGVFALYAFCSTPRYRASALLDLEKPGDLLTGTAGYVPAEDDFIPTQAKLIGSDTALRRVYAELKLGRTKEFGAGVRRLREAVSVLPVPRTRLCAVNAESVDPARAAAIVETLTGYFLNENLNNQLFMPKKILAELDKHARRGDARKFYESLPTVAASAAVQDLKSQLVKAETELAKLRAVFKDDHPTVVAAKNQVARLRAALDSEVDRAVRTFRAELSGQFRPNNVRLVDEIEIPERPISPRKTLALLLGLIGGLAFGGLSALFLENFDQTVRTHKDMEHGLGLPMLGQIPLSRLKKGDKIYAPLVSPDMSSTSEAFRNLRTMVVFAKATNPEPFVLVTSAVAQEGKSFVATNLAVALAQLGRKVLLVDGDLRRPSQHRILASPVKLGLSDLLAGRVSDPGQLLQRAETPFLDVLPGGAPPPNPSELLNADQLAQLVLWARERYDRVIVDCPPVFPVSDILLWGRHIRSSILVSRAGRTRAPLIQMACSQLRSGGIDILGGVINGTRRGSLSSSEGQDFDGYWRRLAQEIPRSEAS